MMRPLSILLVAYPLLAVSEESAGGAEQMLLAVEREMVARGHRTTVAAADRSRVRGKLLATGDPARDPDHYERREREHHERILDYLRQRPRDFDLIHDKSGSFFRRARECPAPMLATLHLPREFYREEWFVERARVSGQQRAANPSTSSGRAQGHRHPAHALPNVYFNCVSNSQALSFADLPNMVGVVQNGVAVEQFPFTREKQDYLLWLGRICEEKAPHLAIAAARSARLPLVIAGQVYPFSYHQAYFEREVRPHLSKSSQVWFVNKPSRAQKIELLRHARALLLTSTVEETSSLVAMEAMACGTPVVAFRRAAFGEIVADGETGFVVDTLEEMTAAVDEADRISPDACRARVEQAFSASRMGRDYESLYERVIVATRNRVAA